MLKKYRIKARNLHRQTRTHVQTLADESPKSRRRVRKTLGLRPGSTLSVGDYALAQAEARRREKNDRQTRPTKRLHP